MSLRAELARLGIRLVFKSRDEGPPDIDKMRRKIDRLSRWIINPPRTTKTAHFSAGSVSAVRVTTPQSRSDHHVLYVHGGGYNYGTPALYRDLTWRIADVARTTVTLPVYRLAPEHPFPAALDDVVTSYLFLLSEDIDPRRLALIGDSAGGGLVFATLLRLRDAGKPLPAATVAISPWVDLSLQSESSISFGRTDPMLSLTEARHLAANYLGSAAPNHPYASPIFGDVSGVPPSLIQVGDDEMLRDDAVIMAQRLRAAGCEVELELWPRMPHVWHTLARLVPEGHRAIERIGAFLHKTWAQAGM